MLMKINVNRDVSQNNIMDRTQCIVHENIRILKGQWCNGNDFIIYLCLKHFELS